MRSDQALPILMAPRQNGETCTPALGERILYLPSSVSGSGAGYIVWRDKMYVPLQCTIARTMGRSAYNSKPNTQKKQLHSVSVKKTL
jgi:hypothetical protein